jgi:tRNA (guanine37-N1)-methyltransferase
MKFKIITIFPRIFDSYLNESIIGRAQANKIISVKTSDLRDYATDKRRSVDDTPYGGGAGMVMKVEPLYKAIKAAVKRKNPKRKIILLSAKGRPWTQELAKKYSQLDELVFICGRYEGVDERILNFIDEEVSVGDYVLTGGELGAMIIIDSVTRLLPGVLGNAESPVDESHSRAGVLEYPQYTKPEIFKVKNKKYRVPGVLLSGDHKKIAGWREDHKTRR